jgi:alkanesulfonate monooxygenase SsuD/methylene tetrahydromethanopterin reductase-like flavin-dependent oxidoreductase (luciferase family)
MRVGIAVLPEHDWPATRAIFAHLEELGFDHAWTYDHLSWRTLRDGPWHAAVPLLAAAAASTTRLRLGTLVASPNFRQPVPFAKDLMTLDAVSNGRFTLGIGAGSASHDASVLGTPAWPLAERTARFAEFVDLLDTLLTESATTFTGQYYAASDARMVPGCVQQPRLPFAIAATGPRGMAVVAKHAQTWVTFGDPALPEADHFAGLPRLLAMLDTACAAIGRDPASIDRLVLTGALGPNFFDSVPEFTDAVGRYAALGFTDVVLHYPRGSEPYRGDVAMLDAIAAALPALSG